MFHTMGNTMEGIVIKATGSWFMVRNDQGDTVPCRLKGKLRLEELKSTSPVAVGDRVDYALEEKGDEGLIVAILPRKNFIVRKATNLSKQTHILAANIDQAVLLVTINYPITTTVFIDRFLASAEAYSIPVHLVFNKVDRYDPLHMQQLEDLRQMYEGIGYQTLAVSARHQEDLSHIKALLKDRTTLIAGHSGVGKSTLVNRLEPGLKLKTRDISAAHHTGTHTTTFAEMHPFSFGGFVIDTPGIRGFGLIQMEKEELSHYFREIFAASSACQFNNCTHLHEPGCAVKEQVSEGNIAESRYNSYVSIMLQKDEKYR